MTVPRAAVSDPPAAGFDLDAFQAIAAVLPEPHWLVTARGEVLTASPAATALLGQPVGALDGTSLHDAVADEPAKVTRYLTMCARSREMIPGALTFHSAAAPVPCRCDAGVLRPGAEGRPALLLLRTRPRATAVSRFVALTDQVDSLHREIALRQGAERLLRQQAEILEQTLDAVVVWALDSGAVTYLNHAAEELYGWTRAEAVDRPVGDVIGTRSGVTHAEIEASLRATGAWAGEFADATRDGRTLLIESRMVLMPGAGEHALVIETARDVTEARRVRARLEDAERLEAVGRVAGGAAHEINNALQGAVGFAALALRRLEPSDPVREDVEQALKASHRAANITQGLLAFSRRQVLQPSKVSLKALVEGFAPALQQALGRDRQLRLDCSPAPLFVHADRGQLEQVLLNFVLNARDATKPGGNVTITLDGEWLDRADLDRLARADLAPARYARLEISDTGHGMDASTVARIFEPFYTTKASGRGTGLGLAVVHGIVHQSGGAISVASAPGEGTTFTVYLPESDADVVPEPAGDGGAPGGAERIMVVDDEQAILDLVSRLLEGEGYTVITATHGGDALEQLEALPTAADGPTGRLRPRPVDLVISDIIMPVLSGRELGELLAARYPDLPVLYTSGHPGEEMIRQGLLVDGAAFIQKPFHPDDLLMRARGLLDRAGRA